MSRKWAQKQIWTHLHKCRRKLRRAVVAVVVVAVVGVVGVVAAARRGGCESERRRT